MLKKGVEWQTILGAAIFVILLFLGFVYLAKVWDPLEALRGLLGLK